MKDNTKRCTRAPRASICFALCTVLLLSLQESHAGAKWALYPNLKFGAIKDYTPVFSKHFTIDGDTLVGNTGLGKPYYDAKKTRTFGGPGPIWATEQKWDKDYSDFELTLDYKWSQPEPGSKYGDFPDTCIGFRLNPNGSGYYLQWGFLGQIRINRIQGQQTIPVCEGILRMYKNNWVKIRVRCAGPIIKAKIWSAKQEEPKNWSCEGYDNWQSTTGSDNKAGKIAVGFQGRRLFDTCKYYFKNVVVKPLDKAAVSSVKFYDAESLPPIANKGSWKRPIKRDTALVALTGKAKLESYTKDGNLEIVSITRDGTTIRSKDGKPAFLWKATRYNTRKFTIVTSIPSPADASPLLAITDRTQESPNVAILAPNWRPGILAVLSDNPQHTAGVAPFQLKANVDYRLTTNAAHWVKWQAEEEGNSSVRVTQSARVFKVHKRSKKLFGIGVMGKGTVLIRSAH